MGAGRSKPPTPPRIVETPTDDDSTDSGAGHGSLPLVGARHGSFALGGASSTGSLEPPPRWFGADPIPHIGNRAASFEHVVTRPLSAQGALRRPPGGSL